MPERGSKRDDPYRACRCGARIRRDRAGRDAAKKVLATFSESDKAKTLFPDTSKTGGDTAALPAIWENKADFEAKLTKFAADAKAAGPKVTDLDTFKAQMTEVRKNCGGCHQPYRKRAS
jgi:cytochrome c556